MISGIFSHSLAMGSWNAEVIYVYCGLFLKCLFYTCPGCGQSTFAALIPLFHLRLLGQDGCQRLLVDLTERLTLASWACPLLNQHYCTVLYLTRQGYTILEELAQRVSYSLTWSYLSVVPLRFVYESVSPVRLNSEVTKWGLTGYLSSGLSVLLETVWIQQMFVERLSY